MWTKLMQCCLLLATASPALADTPWLPGNWEHRVLVSATPSQIAGNDTFEDFALLVLLDDQTNPDIFADAQNDGSDLVFTASDGVTLLAREVVSFDTVDGRAEIWVRVPAFAKTANAIYLYFGNPGASLPASPPGAWADEYRVVYHFEDDPGAGVLTDSSPQAAHAYTQPISNWTSSDVAEGQIGQSWNFNGTTHHVNSTNISTNEESYSISVWLEHTSDSSDFVLETNPDFWHISSQDYPFGGADYGDGSNFIVWNPIPIAHDADLHHFEWCFDAAADTVIFYYDGVPRSTYAALLDTPGLFYTGRKINPDKSQPVGILGGMFYVTDDLHMGRADEFRIREGVPSADRVVTEFRSQDDNAGFLDFGTTESMTGTSVTNFPVVSTLPRLRISSHPNPTAGRSLIQYALGEAGPVRISVYDVAGREVARLVDRSHEPGVWTVSWNGRDQAGLAVATGVYFVRIQTPYGYRSTKLTLVR